MKEFCDIPIDPTDGPAITFKADMDREAFAQEHLLTPTGRVSLFSNVFVAFIETMRQIVQGVRWDKKARIVLEYDPQEAKFQIITFMESAELDPPGDRESP